MIMAFGSRISLGKAFCGGAIATIQHKPVRLFAAEEGKSFVGYSEPDSMRIVTAQAEPAMAPCAVGASVQLERWATPRERH